MNLATLLDIPTMIVPDAPALIDTRREGPLRTYAVLRERAARATGVMRDAGVLAGDRVAIFATNCEQYVDVIFGTAALGAVAVPMNFRAASDEVRHLLTDSGARMAFTERRYAAALEANRPVGLETVVYLDDDYEHFLATAAPDETIADVDDGDIAVLLYTSGTTSHPKGVKLSHGSLTTYVMDANDAADGSDVGRMLLAAPLYHVAGLTSMLNSLFAGRITVLMPQFDAGEWLDAVRRHAITHAFLVPTMLARLLDSSMFEQADLGSLRALTYGAAPMPPSVIRRAVDAFPADVAFSGAYGQTETTSTVAVLGPDDHRLTGSPREVEARIRRLRSVGRVLDDVDVRIVDEHGDLLGPGETGEVHLRTARAMKGYWGADEKTRVTIGETGWIHTGDLGYLDDDRYLFLVGRAGDMIIRGGENVAPEEVEAVIGEHADVVECGVVGLDDEEWGQRIAAAIVMRDGGDVDAIVGHAHDHLAPFKRPATWHVVDALPRTSTGKLLRRELPAILDERAPSA